MDACHVCVVAGDSVKTDDIIAQIETDKVTIDIRAPHDGVIQSLNVRWDLASQRCSQMLPHPAVSQTSKCLFQPRLPAWLVVCFYLFFRSRPVMS